MCIKSTLSDVETQILCALSNNAKATDRLKFTGGFFLWVSFRIYLQFFGYNIIAVFFHLRCFSWRIVTFSPPCIFSLELHMLLFFSFDLGI